MAEAKSDYESNLIFNFVHTHHNKIYQYLSNIKGQDNFHTQMFYINQHAKRKPNYLIITLLSIFHQLYYSSQWASNGLQVLAHY